MSEPRYTLDVCGRNGHGYARDVSLFFPGPQQWFVICEAFQQVLRSESGCGREDDPLIYHVTEVDGRV